MLRQVHIFHNGNTLFTHSFALGLGKEELNNVIKVIKSYMDMPMPNKIFHRPISNFQIFHGGAGSLYFIMVADLIDSLDYIERIFKKFQSKFKEMFPDPEDINEEGPNKDSFIDLLYQLQADLHSKIAIAGPVNSGKTTLYNMLKSPSSEERSIMNFAKTFSFNIGELQFDIWDFMLQDNFSLMWPKHIIGADLVILIIDLSKYNLKIVDHFLNFKKREARYSKYLVLGNKRDLVSEEDVKIIRNELGELGGLELEDIALNSPDAHGEVLNLITKELNLKKPLPPNFNKLINEAKKLDAQNQTILAIAKYKELINIAYKYQDTQHIREFESALEDLQRRREEEIEFEKEKTRKSKFSKPEKIDFKSRVSVKTLPTAKKLPSVKSNAPGNAVPVKVSKLASEAANRPPAKIAPKSPQKASTSQNRKLSLQPNDFKIVLPGQAVEGRKTPEKKAPKVNSESQSIRPVHFIPYDKNIADEIISDPSFDFSEILYEIIENNGSQLSKELCEQYIDELLKVLERPLTIEDLNIAARSFIEKEKGE